MTSFSLSKDKIKILLLEKIHASAIETFRAQGYTNIETYDHTQSHSEIFDKLNDIHFLGIRSRTHIDAEVLSHCKKLVGIGCFCIGTNQVDLLAASQKGIPVFNAPFSNTRSVAELVLAEIILLLRRIPKKNALAHTGVWQKGVDRAVEARGKNLGIIGYGHIGTQLGILAEGLGMHVFFHDIEHKLPLGNAQQIPLHELLQRCDVVSLHVPETPETKNFINASTLNKMQKGSILINASRGHVVELDALKNALESEHLLGAALDVFPHEPENNHTPFECPLQGMQQVILTPHIGGSTEEAQHNIGLEVAEKLIKFSDNGSTVSAVNFPEVSLPQHAACSRILHIHENRPGMMNQINQLFADHKINISGQYLQTSSTLGYVVTDIEAPSTEEIVQALKAIQGTIRTRLLK